MATNLLKCYNELLELSALSIPDRKTSLMRVFIRDIAENQNFRFRAKQLNPTPKDGLITMDTLFTHLTTIITDPQSRHREFDFNRSVRLHWVKHHLDESKEDKMLYFSVKEPEGVRTYIYDEVEKYVIVLEPLRNKDEYYLLTAYYLIGKDAKRDKMKNKYKRKLPELV